MKVSEKFVCQFNLKFASRLRLGTILLVFILCCLKKSLPRGIVGILSIENTSSLLTALFSDSLHITKYVLI